MVKKVLVSFLGVILVLCFTFTAFAEELTPKLCRDKVIAAVKLLEAEGEAAFDKVRDPEGEFRFGNDAGYIWIHSLEKATMLMHPIKPNLEGKNLLGIQDKNGILFFMASNEIVEDHGSGWVAYAWPKPGEDKASPKISYVKLAEYNGKSFVAGSGMYDVVEADIKKQFSGDAIYEP